MDSPNLDRALRIKTNSYRGGVIENIRFRQVQVGQVAEAVVDIDFHYEEGAGGKFLPEVRSIAIENVTCKKSVHALRLRGFDTAPIRDIRLTDCTFENVAKQNVIENVQGLKMSRVTLNGERLASG